ncbi:GtrA family protein [Desulfobacterota bacterium]|mgnify:FL=1|jgi:putative flippase GtrA|nr:GtrA family protein [Thermodesulfobacteriota bacterium]|tara:strand:- start:564 stop:971 length:408 start_codon:yes stop_codon:yes gene_type:complete
MLKIVRYIIMLLKDPKTYKWGTIGIFALICDYWLYNFLLDKIGMDIAKAASTFLGVNISFHFNRLWTFKSESAYFDDLKRYLALYVVAILVNVVVNNFAFKVVQDIDLAYFIALFVSVIIGYFGQRLWVFKNRVK